MSNRSTFRRSMGKLALTVVMLAATTALSGCFSKWIGDAMGAGIGPLFDNGGVLYNREQWLHAELVTVTPDSGQSGQVVTFQSSIQSTNGRPDWVWVFGGGCNPNETKDFNPAVTLGAPGTYEGNLVAHSFTDKSIPDQVYKFTFVVTAPGANPEGNG